MIHIISTLDEYKDFKENALRHFAQMSIPSIV
jgi:hypothetical protein